MGKLCDIRDLHTFASNRQGLLLSTEYINSKINVLWQCKEGHQWKATWDGIRNGSTWCPICNTNKRKATITEIQQYAINKGGLLLSAEYSSSKVKLLWQCNKGHQWNALWTNTKKNHWCPYCAGNNRPVLSDLISHAKSKNGLLLSNNYKNNNQLLDWQCKEGHQWKASWNSIKDMHSWCPECASFKTEYLCKQLLEARFGFSFIKTRFKYNKHTYEFDGYNEYHKAAFEYQGIQHYIYPNHWHKTKDDFLEAQQRDKDKVQYCKENSIKLIIIPYTVGNVESYITTLELTI